MIIAFQASHAVIPWAMQKGQYRMCARLTRDGMYFIWASGWDFESVEFVPRTHLCSYRLFDMPC